MDERLTEFLLAHEDLEVRLMGAHELQSIIVTVKCRRTGAVHGGQLSINQVDDPERFVEELSKLDAFLDRGEVPGEPRIRVVPCMACGHTARPWCDCQCHAGEVRTFAR